MAFWGTSRYARIQGWAGTGLRKKIVPLPYRLLGMIFPGCIDSSSLVNLSELLSGYRLITQLVSCIGPDASSTGLALVNM